MKETKKQPVVYAFIDSQNVNLAIQDQGWKLDFRKLRVYLTDNHHAKKAFLFLGYIKRYQRLYSQLRRFGYILIFKPTVSSKDGDVKGNVDAELVLHAMIEYPNYEQAIIATGDGDFYCLLEYLNKKDKLARLIIPNRYKYSSLLRRFLGNVLFLSGLREKLEYKKERH